MLFLVSEEWKYGLNDLHRDDFHRNDRRNIISFARRRIIARRTVTMTITGTTVTVFFLVKENKYGPDGFTRMNITGMNSLRKKENHGWGNLHKDDCYRDDRHNSVSRFEEKIAVRTIVTRKIVTLLFLLEENKLRPGQPSQGRPWL